jgi:TolB-like protein
MNRVTRFLMVILMSLLSLALHGQNKQRLGILPFTGGVGGDGETIAMLLSYRTEIQEAFVVVPRISSINSIMAEQQFQRSGLTDSDTISSLGRQLNADFVVAGHIQDLGDRHLILITIINVESLEQVAGDYREYSAIEEIQNLIPDMAKRLIAATRLDLSQLPKLAVLPFNIPTEVNQDDAEVLAQLLATEVANSGKYAVLPRTKTIELAMQEQQIQRSGITDPSSIKAIGKATNAQYVLAGDVRSLGSLNMFAASILNVNDGSQLIGNFENYRNIEDGLALMAKLSEKLTGVAPGSAGTVVAAATAEGEAEKPQSDFDLIREAAETGAKKKPQKPASPATSAWKNKRLYLGLRGGASFGTFELSEGISHYGYEGEAMGYSGAVQMGLQLGSAFALQAEAVFEQSTVDFMVRSMNDTSASFTSSALIIPILAKLTFRPGIFLLSPFVGAHFTLPLGQMDYSDGYDDVSYDYSAPVGLSAGADIGIKLGSGVLFADIRYLMDSDYTRISDGYGVLSVYKRKQVSISLGYEFGLINRRKK